MSATPTAEIPRLSNTRMPWDAATLHNDLSWTYEFTAGDRTELIAALEFFKITTHSRGLTAQWLHGNFSPTPELFPLPNLSAVLNRFRLDLENKYGIVLFRGFPVQGLEKKDIQLLYAGLASYIGTPRPQTVFGELVQDIRDSGQSSLIERRGSKHNRGLGFHNDPCDVNGFLCLKAAQSGGEGIFASSVSIHNKLLETSSRALATLYGDFYNTYQDYLFVKTGFNEAILPAEKVYRMPTFSCEKGYLACKYSRFYIDQAQELAEVPRLTPDQIEALNAFEQELQNPQWQLSISYAPGDIVFTNNFICLHGRNPFVDDNRPDAPKRHLLRIWLSVSNSRPLSPRYRHYFFQDINAGALRGGLHLPPIHYY